MPTPERSMSDRAGFLRRAGAGAAGLSLAQLLGPASALAAGGGGDFPPHPRWRFVFVSHQTLDPLFVATQFGARTRPRSSSARCNGPARRAGTCGDGEGHAVGDLGQGRRDRRLGRRRERFSAPAGEARKAGIPVVAFNVDLSSGGRLAYVGENPYTAGARVGAEIGRLAPDGEVVLLAPRSARPWIGAAVGGIEGGSAACRRRPRRPGPSVGLAERAGGQDRGHDPRAPCDPRRVRDRGRRDGGGGPRDRAPRARCTGVHAGGFDLLPAELALVAGGSLDFAVDQQAYLQGFNSVLQLFLARISEGIVLPADSETSVLLRKADVQQFLRTKSRFEGSSSRHEYPLRRV